MSIASQNLLTNHSHTRISFYFKTPNLKTPNFSSFSLPFSNSPHFQTSKIQSVIPFKFQSIRAHRYTTSVGAFDSDGAVDKQYFVSDAFDVDVVLSVAEFFCLASSAVISIGFAINSAFSTSQKPVLEWFGNRAPMWQSLLLVSGIVIGAVIRRRQWKRVCVGFSKPGSSSVNLIDRIEKVEDDLRSSSTMIRMLSRQLEKLGIRFRVTRRSMKDPIAETAALAQKNSEATRALAAQEDFLEKELLEIQNVLLAMQEQQQKQLDLILAIAKTGKVRTSKQTANQDHEKSATGKLTGEKVEQMKTKQEKVEQMKTKQIQVVAKDKENNNDSLPI